MIFLHLFTLLNSALLLLLLLLNVVLLCEGHQHEHISAMDVKLRAHLFNNLSIHTRPVINQSEPIKVCILIFCYISLKFICYPFLTYIFVRTIVLPIARLFGLRSIHIEYFYSLLYDLCSHAFVQYSSYVGRENGIVIIIIWSMCKFVVKLILISFGSTMNSLQFRYTLVLRFHRLLKWMNQLNRLSSNSGLI